MAGYQLFLRDELDFSPPSSGDPTRALVRLSEAMSSMRGNLWRLSPGSRGRRHSERAQEELFVVLEGEATLLLGEPPRRVALPAGSLAVVEPGTASQLRNDGQGDAVVLVVGAPPVLGETDYLPDA